jgi:hypothetical protein
MKPSPKRPPIALLSVVAVGSLVVNVVLFIYLNSSKTTVVYRDAPTSKETPAPAPQDESDKIVERVRRLMSIPEDAPTVATVTDPDKLRNQAFFAKAKLGDKVLIFSASKKVILYDPVADQILNVAPLSVNSATAPKSL